MNGCVTRGPVVDERSERGERTISLAATDRDFNSNIPTLTLTGHMASCLNEAGGAVFGMSHPSLIERLTADVAAWNAWRMDRPLTELDLRGANLSGLDLRGADLWYANLQGANLRGALLSGANLDRVDLSQADLRVANLHGATMRGALIERSSLKGACLAEADLTVTSFLLADLTATVFTGATLLGTRFFDCDIDAAFGIDPDGGWQLGDESNAEKPATWGVDRRTQFLGGLRGTGES